METFYRGPSRFLGSDDVPLSVNDTIFLDEEARQYQACPGFIELGVTRTGVRVSEGRVDTTLVEQWSQDRLRETWADCSVLIALRQHYQTTEIHGLVFTKAVLLDNADAPRRGECSAMLGSW